MSRFRIASSTRRRRRLRCEARTVASPTRTRFPRPEYTAGDGSEIETMMMFSSQSGWFLSSSSLLPSSSSPRQRHLLDDDDFERRLPQRRRRISVPPLPLFSRDSLYIRNERKRDLKQKQPKALLRKRAPRCKERERKQSLRKAGEKAMMIVSLSRQE